jgi:uncharacterized protein YjdB
MKKHFQKASALYVVVTTFTFLIALLVSVSSNAQCVANPGVIQGSVFDDKNNSGSREIGELPISNVLVSIFNSTNQLVAFQPTNNLGEYIFSGLVDGNQYRLSFEYMGKYASSFVGNDSGTDIQFSKSPKCNASLGLVIAQNQCSSNPELFTTCFVQGSTSVSDNGNVESIVGLEHNFGGSSTVKKYASHAETGSVWGLAWKSTSSDLFSAAFVKQYSGLTSHGHGAIYKTRVTGTTGTTTKFTTMNELGINVGHLTNDKTATGSLVTIGDCNFGKFVGKTGLGSMVISPSEEFLYVVNLYNKSLVKLPTVNPTATNVEEITIPNPNCSNGEYAPFALKYFNDKIYIGVTCTEETNHSDFNSMAVVYEFDPEAKTFTNIFSTNYLKGYWSDVPDDITTQHWFTDLDFTDEGNMILSFSDRIGHKYCKTPNRLDHQFPDILMAWKNNGVWTLESNGKAGTLTGTGVGNSQGPEGGEFFGDDYWITQPLYHPEIALGSVFVLPGSKSVVAAAYDPATNSYSGGFQRYSTETGSKLGAKELYTRQSTVLFGKATGFGDIIGRCGLPSIQVGNLVWYDANNNGIQDASELPVSNLTLNLLDENCNQVAQTQTNQSGNYEFSNIVPGAQYYVSLPTNVLDNYNLISLNNNNFTFSPLGSGASIDNNASVLTGVCANAVVPVKSTKTNHTLDIGLIQANGFDLALKNEIVNPDFFRKNELVDFKITVYNQGGIPAKNIKIVNYVPSGFMFNASENPLWTLTGNNAMTTLPNVLLPGASTSINISLRLMSNDVNNLIDVAEIVSATDQNGVAKSDIDSNSDDTNGNDNGGQVNTNTDNKIDDSGSIDEDDEDPAIPMVVDLALKQTLAGQCFNAGDCNTINISVYNQGTVAASSFGIVNYFGNFLTLGNNNPAWTLTSGKLYYTGAALEVGESISVPLNVCLKEGLLNNGILNYAEISEIKVNGVSTIKDYDSNPDALPTNDAGGTYDTNQDNNISGAAGVEEDDHDPVYITVTYIDLALKLATDKRKVKEGDDVCFKATIYNQGNETVKQVEIVDYVPAHLSLNDANWSLNGSIAKRTINFENGFAPGDEYVTEICFKVKNITDVFYIENVAEISGGMNTCDQSIANKDIDSDSDINQFNDLGGRPLTETDNLVDGLPSIDEDDQDPAVLISYVIVPTGCVCLANATNTTNGQYAYQVKLRGPKGMKWTIDQVLNLYKGTSAAPPASPTPFIIGLSGDTLTEVPVPGPVHVSSDYILNGIFEDGKNFSIVLRSSDDDYELITGGGCSYTPIVVNGVASMCTSSNQVYSVAPSLAGYSVSMTGGTITSSNTDSSKVTVAWGAIPGSYKITFKSKDLSTCKEPGILNVAIGSPDLALACKSNIQVSLDNDCSVEITPAMIVAGEMSPLAPYVVMLTDDKGNPLPGNAVTNNHIGKKITVKLIEGCSGNSCWGTVGVDDKTGPVILCTDTVEVACYKADVYPGPLASDNCTAVAKLIVVDSFSKLLYCNPKYNQFIDKKYIAVDKYGNKSQVCNQTIAVKRIAMDSIKFPADIEMPNALTCNGYLKDSKGMPAPSVTGSPVLNGNNLYPTLSSACNIGIDYVDRDFGYIGCARKIMRVWTVYEAWCTAGVIRKDTQTIIIADVKNPTFACPKNVTVSAAFGECEALVNFPALVNITDDCATTFNVDIKYPGGFIDNQNGGTATLQTGVSTITYTVYDECLNRDSCKMTVTVVDKTAPTVVCDRATTVGITSLGEGYIYASTINDGSYDACGIDSMRIRRMDAGAPCLLNQGFSNIAKFCCADVGKEIMVELKIWDLQGNANSCMVSVLVQDKTVPKITCPDNVTISCEVDIDVNNLSAYGNATAIDACGATVTSTANATIDQCRAGSIERIFTASDANNSVRCTSYIYIQRPTNNLNIKWPESFTTTNGCNPIDLDPKNLQPKFAKPTFDDGICDLVAASFEDNYFEVNGSGTACFYIVRTWTVIDWCRKNEVGYKPAEFDQLITVINTVDPTLELDADDEACTDDNNCDEGFIDLVALGSDDCTPLASLAWKYQIDFDFNGTFVADVTNAGRGARIDASGTYDVGKHRILFTFEDRCGNQVSEFHDFLIKNCKAPIPVCIQGTSISLQQMVVNGQTVRMACIPARSINVSSSHPCGYKLNYSFSSNINDTTKCFNCMDIGRRDITLFVTDEFGNASSCSTFIDVQNNDPALVGITASKESICPGETVTLTAVGVGTILWSTGATTRTISVIPSGTTTYAVSVTSQDQCTLMASKVITVNPSPSALINTSISGTTAICPGVSTTLTATGGGTYSWNTTPVQTTASINVSPITNTTYIVTVTSAQGCTATASRAITINPRPTPTLAALPATLCLGGVSQLSINGLAPVTSTNTYTYNWNTVPSGPNPISTGPTASVTPPVGVNTYAVTVTNNAGCSATSSGTVTVNALPVVSISGVSTICAGSTTTLSPTTGGTWISNNPTIATVTNTGVVTGVTAGSATFTFTNTTTSCLSTTLPVTVLARPVVGISGAAAICISATTTLTPTTGGTWTSSNPAVATVTNAGIVTGVAAGSATFTFTNTTTTCTNTTSAITVNPKPAVSITGTNSICVGFTTTLSPTTGGSWTSSSNSIAIVNNSGLVTGISAGTATFIFNNGCPSDPTAVVTVNPKPVVTIASSAICIGSTTTVTPNTGGTWTSSNTSVATVTNAGVVTGVAAGSASLIFTNTSTGCVSLSLPVTVNTSPTVSITGATMICEGFNTTLSPTSGGIWTSSNPTVATVTNAGVVTGVSAGTATFTFNNGCPSSPTPVVTVIAKPIVTIASQAICVGNTTTVTPTTGGAWSSSNPTVASVTNAGLVTGLTSGTATFTFTNTAGCISNPTTILNVIDKPVVSISGAASVCVGLTTTLSPTTGGTWTSSNPAIATVTNAGIVTGVAAGSATFTFTNTNTGCVSNPTGAIIVNPKPVATIAGSNSICIGTTTTLNPSTGGTWVSNTASIASVTNAGVVTGIAAGSVTFTFTSTAGCISNPSPVVTVNPTPVASISGDLNICINESTTLTATGGGTYSWNTTPVQTIAAITVSPTTTTTYTVTVTNNGCTNTSSATVVVNPNNTPIANCQNITVKLNAQGTISITGAQINNNSTPGCDNGTLSFSVTPSTFFCNDVTVPPSGIPVVLTVTSSTGPSATCPALVTVLDTIVPNITCPANLSINCSIFNGLQGLASATATDNCTSPASGTSPAFPNVVVVSTINATNVCNIGTITRTFRATDRAGNTSECTQTITVTPSTDPLVASDITFPTNVNLTSCSNTTPAVTGSPSVNTQNATCTKVSVTFTDVNSGPPCNFTIARTWRVVDSCQLNPSAPTAGIFTNVQTISVVDNQPPVITGYVDIVVNDSICPTFVNYNMAGVSITDCSTLTITNNSPNATNMNSGNPSGFYEAGVYNIIVTAMDQCGLMTKDTFRITVNLTSSSEFVKCKKIIRNITDQDFVDVKAREFIDFIAGTCSPEEHMYSYSRTVVTDTTKRFTCDSLNDRRVFVYHYKNGVLVDSCKSIVTILDPSGFCTGIIFRVVGEINTENFVPVKDVEINLGENMPKVMTDVNGRFSLPNMVPNGNYMLQPLKNDGILEGVSTLDLIMIQRHILGSAKINSAYRMIAADVNNDNKITAADLVELRKVILGVNTKFKNNTSWKTIDSRYQFADSNNPFNDAYPLYYEFIEPKGQMIADFIGVKVGDVNNSYVANVISDKKANIILEASNNYYEQSHNVLVDFNITDIKKIDGAQFSFNVSELGNVSVTSSILSNSQFDYNVEGDQLYISIAPDVTFDLNNQPLFTIQGFAKTSGLSSELIKMENELVKNEIYSDLKPIAVKQTWKNNQDFVVDQNNPNPWNEKTTINFSVPRSGNVKFILSDIKGSRIINNTIPVEKGLNNINISSEVIGSQTGVFFYEISFEGKSQFGKMIRIK